MSKSSFSEVTSITEATKPEEKKNLLAGNVWNVDGLIKSRTDEDGKIVTCAATKKQLFYIRKDGTKIMLHSFGECNECEEIFHEEYLYMPDDTSKSSWPVEWEGRHCRSCHSHAEE